MLATSVSEIDAKSMKSRNPKSVAKLNALLYLSWESPCPPHSGAALRSYGLLRELGKEYEIEMFVISRQPLSDQVNASLLELAHSVDCISLRDRTLWEKLRAFSVMVRRRIPYHSAVLMASLHGHSEIQKRIVSYPGIVFTSNGHWGTLVRDHRAPNWILNQCDADVDFWRVYASQVRNRLTKAAAYINWRLSKSHFKKIYRQVGRILSVCEQDKLLTRKLAPVTAIDIIENGIDCSSYIPIQNHELQRPPRLLFTGTSAKRNITALHWFTRRVLPEIRKSMPTAELCVAGDFQPRAQKKFSGIPGIYFTGKVGNIRAFFNRRDVYIAPFKDAHGSKLKIAEAMAMAMAIVATPAGIRGFSLIDNESVRVAQTPNEFAQKCLELLKDDSLRLKLGRSARQLALQTIDWRLLGRRLRKIVHEQEAYWHSSQK